jgi:GrpB-like predicted nucleotidyltransferase (UPF0157 family)
MPDSILIEKYDPFWTELFRREADRIRTALGDRALRVEHIGSTSVPLLAAKPIIDILLVVADSADEAAYAPDLESAGYSLRFRKPIGMSTGCSAGRILTSICMYFRPVVRKSIES